MGSKFYTIFGLVLVALTFVGCVTPLKSDDPAVRSAAMAKITDEKELFLIAQNVGVSIGHRSGEYTDLSLVEETYYDDVRVAAVDRLKDVSYLLKCASWQDGDSYVDPEMEHGRMEYRGESFQVHESTSRLHQKVHAGDVVRNRAVERLKSPMMFSGVCDVLSVGEEGCQSGRDGASRGVHGIFPVGVGWNGSYWKFGAESSFVDYYGHVRKGNPLDKALVEVIKAQHDQALLGKYICVAVTVPVECLSLSVVEAIERLDGKDQPMVCKAFESVERSRQQQKDIPAVWQWKLLDKIEQPTEDMLMAAVKTGAGDDKAIVERVAEKQFTEKMWARCYIEGLYKEYGRDRQIRNIKEASILADVLVKAKSIPDSDAEYALGAISDPRLLKRIAEGAQDLKVAARADLLHFDIAYRSILEEIGGNPDLIDRALSALAFKRKLAKSSIAADVKATLTDRVDGWIKEGLVRIKSASEKSGCSFGGFYAGMKRDWAELLKQTLYEDEDVTWLADEDGTLYRLNLGRTFLAELFNYDAQTWEGWIRKYSKSSGRKFTKGTLQDEKRPIGGRGTAVRVSQDIWRFQDNAKNVTLTYFGDKTITEIEQEGTGFVEGLFKVARGITGGDVVKHVMLEGARNWASREWEKGAGGYAGMMRIETGAYGPGGKTSVKGPNGRTGLGETADSLKDTWDAIKGVGEALKNL